jgi:pimeloyl-ACP methyl ester carboxylesterase
VARAKANGIEIEYETAGNKSDPALLLIMGLGAQLTRWPRAFLERLASHGFRVICFDNRDVGLSTKLEAAGLPDFPTLFQALSEGRQPDAPYLLDDMAADTVGLLDALGIERAHIVGGSLGGMIAQLVAADYPHRTLSLTSIMSRPGNGPLPDILRDAATMLNSRGPDPLADFEAYLDHGVKMAFVTGSPAHPPDPAETRARIRDAYQRSYYLDGFKRQYAAALGSPDRRTKLATIRIPTVVIHGAADPLMPLAAGKETAALIPGAELRVIEGMGHDLPPALFDTVIDGILSAVQRAKEPALGVEARLRPQGLEAVEHMRNANLRAQ